MYIDLTSAGVPAPFWFVQFFKWLGFTLHTIPMNLWFAGLLIGLWLHLRGNNYAKHFAGRLLRQMPIIVALGINFGIVPLLFIQVAYYKVFYPATILMAWFWLSIIGLLIPAYYGVYAYAWGVKNGAKMESWRVAAGWIACAFFLTIGFLFVNGLTLMEHVSRWPELWKNNNIAGAATGLALNITDPAVYPRWLLMFGFALGTTAVWMLVDLCVLGGEKDEAYRNWAIGFAKKLYTVSLGWTIVVWAAYIFGTWSQDLFATMFSWPIILLTLLTIGAPTVPWMTLMGVGERPLTRPTVTTLALGQFLVLGLNAATRQTVQNLNLSLYPAVLDQPTDVQWSPIAMFLIVFALGVAVIAWMLWQIPKSKSA
jgi:hypothetical protein